MFRDFLYTYLCLMYQDRYLACSAGESWRRNQCWEAACLASLQKSHLTCCCEALLTANIAVWTAPPEEAVPQRQSTGCRKKPVQKQQGMLCGLDALCQAPVRTQAAGRTPESLVRVSLRCSLHCLIEDAQMWSLHRKEKFKNAYRSLEDYVE